MAELMILGGGVAGISAAYHAQQLGKKAVIYEARPRWGGLADNFSIDGFRFDHAVHFAFTDDPYSVSYTHLDVYKRQMLVRAPMNCFGAIPVGKLLTGWRN